MRRLLLQVLLCLVGMVVLRVLFHLILLLLVGVLEGLCLVLVLERGRHLL
jgi:hypothetical protein